MSAPQNEVQETSKIVELYKAQVRLAEATAKLEKLAHAFSLVSESLRNSPRSIDATRLSYPDADSVRIVVADFQSAKSTIDQIKEDFLPIA